MFAENKTEPIPDRPNVPGTVIDHSPASSKSYIGSPSIAVLPNGHYVASHDFFGPGTKYNAMVVFGSQDKGKSWKQLTRMTGQWWSNLFVHDSALYLFGTSREYGHIVIRRSRGRRQNMDSAEKWEDWANQDRFSVPLCPHADSNPQRNIWSAFELVKGQRPQWATLVLSASVDADLLNAENWCVSKNRLRISGPVPSRSRGTWFYAPR